MDKNFIIKLILLVIFLILEAFFACVLHLINEMNETDLGIKYPNENTPSLKRIKNLVPYTSYIEVNAYIGLILINIGLGGIFLPVFSDFAKNLTLNSSFISQLGWHWNLVFHIFFICAFDLIFVILTFSFGCLIPRRLIRRLGLKRSANFLWFGMICSFIFMPFAMVSNLISRLILNIFGYKRIVEERDVTEEEILSVVNEGCEQGVIEDSEAAMISNIIEFGDKETKDVMTNRSSISAIDIEMSLKEVLEFILSDKKSRYPVYEENLDRIIGILNFKDFILFMQDRSNKDASLREAFDIFREAEFVPETLKIDTLFHNMKKTKQQMVIVVDEYGQTSGLVCLEDILEEIVGDILDEYDEEEDFIEQTGELEYEIDGLTPLEELEEQLHIHFDTSIYDTLNGFMISRLEHIPSEGENFELNFEGYSFSVLKVENKIIKTVLVRKLPDFTNENMPNADEFADSKNQSEAFEADNRDSCKPSINECKASINEILEESK